jgi:hypothetical protein
MANQVRANRSTANSGFKTMLSSLVSGGMNVAAIDGLLRLYGDGEPLYSLIEFVGMPSKVINDVSNPFETHADVVKATKNGEAAITVSTFDGRDVYTLAVKAPQGNGIYYFSLYHNKDREPQVDGQLYLAKVQVDRDFQIEIDGVKTTILEKGKVIFKAVPEAYAEGLYNRAQAKKAA